MAKCVLKVAGQEAKEAFGATARVGVEVIIEGGVHAMCLLWVQQS